MQKTRARTEPPAPHDTKLVPKQFGTEGDRVDDLLINNQGRSVRLALGQPEIIPQANRLELVGIPSRHLTHEGHGSLLGGEFGGRSAITQGIDGIALDDLVMQTSIRLLPGKDLATRDSPV